MLYELFLQLFLGSKYQKSHWYHFVHFQEDVDLNILNASSLEGKNHPKKEYPENNNKLYLMVMLHFKA